MKDRLSTEGFFSEPLETRDAAGRRTFSTTARASAGTPARPATTMVRAVGETASGAASRNVTRGAGVKDPPLPPAVT